MLRDQSWFLVRDDSVTFNDGFIIYDTILDQWSNRRNVTMPIPTRGLSCTLIYQNETPIIFAVGNIVYGYVNGDPLSKYLKNYPGLVTFAQGLSLADQEDQKTWWTLFKSLPKWWGPTRQLVNFGRSVDTINCARILQL